MNPFLTGLAPIFLPLLHIFGILVVKHQLIPSLIDFHSLTDEVAVLVVHQIFDNLVNRVHDTKKATESDDACEYVRLIFIEQVVIVDYEVH